MNKAIIGLGFVSIFLMSACSEKSVPTPESVAISSVDSGAPVKKQAGVKPIIKKDAAPVVVELPLFEIYGELAPVGYVDDANPITEKYGFRVKRIAGCEVGSAESDSVDRNNKKSLEAMDKKYGKDWRKKFTAETKLNLTFPL